jgi:hypothetical protein
MILLECINDTNCALIKRGKKYKGHAQYNEDGIQVGWNIPNIFWKYPIRCFAKTHNIPKNIKTI